MGNNPEVVGDRAPYGVPVFGQSSIKEPEDRLGKLMEIGIASVVSDLTVHHIP